MRINMTTLKLYTKPIIENKYSNSMAHSIHFSLIEDEHETPLNQGYGILFPRAKILENNTLSERGVLNPTITCVESIYYIKADLIDKDANPVPEAKEVCWSTKDFIDFEELGSTLPEDIKDCTFSTSVELSSPLLPSIKSRWIPLESKEVILPENIIVSDVKDIIDYKATVVYTDGSTDDKVIDFDYSSVEALPDSDNQYRIKGKINPVRTGFPLTTGYADPVIFPWEGSWYFLATNDNVDDIGMFVRKADTIEELFDEKTKEYCILDYDEERGFIQTFWAPEFHIIGDDLYILFAVGPKDWGPQCHMMKLKKGGEIINATDWETPIRVIKKDGKPLTETAITLDMTYFKAGGTSYLSWSYREYIGSPLDSGSMIMIATIDEKEPWKLTSEPVLLSRPQYGWENTCGTINNEGPYPLLLNGKVYLSFSGGDACGYYYAVGYLIADENADLLDVTNWKKTPTSVLNFSSIPGIIGPGHNSFFRDDNGTLMIAYHAQEREKTFNRCSAFHRVHVSIDGFPLLNVEGDRDVSSDLQEVEVVFSLK